MRRLAHGQRSLRDRDVPERDPDGVYAFAAAAHVDHVHVRAGELLVAHRAQPLVGERRRLLAIETAIERVQLRCFEHAQHFRPVGDPFHADAPAVARHHALHERGALDQRVLLLQVLHHHAARLQDGVAVDQPADEQVAVGGDAAAQLVDVGQGAGAVAQVAELRARELHLRTLKLDSHGQRATRCHHGIMTSSAGW